VPTKASDAPPASVSPLAEMDAKGYPIPPNWKGNSAAGGSKEQWAALSPGDQRSHWWMLMSGGSMSDQSTEQDLKDFIDNGGRHPAQAEYDKHGAIGGMMPRTTKAPDRSNWSTDDHIQRLKATVMSELERNPELIKQVEALINKRGALPLPHRFSVKGSKRRVADVLAHKAESVERHFGTSSETNLVLGAYGAALLQLSMLKPEPDQRLHLFLVVSQDHMQTLFKMEDVKLPAGMDSVEQWEKSEEVTLSVQTDGGIGNLALKHGIKLNVPEADRHGVPYSGGPTQRE
jgi:hypothetical protein